MKFHIIRTGECLKDILFLYNLTKDELVEDNRHIRVWDKLIPGTKLKIPAITESIDQDLNDMEPFIEDYYPKLESDQVKFEEQIFSNVENEVSLDPSDSSNDYSKDLIKESNSLDDQIKTIEVTHNNEEGNQTEKVKTAKPYQPYVLGYYNNTRVVPYPYYYYPVYYKKRSR